MDFFGMLADAAVKFGESAIDVAAGGVAWVLGTLADLLIVLSAALPDGGIWELPEVGGMWEHGLGWLNWWLPIGQLAAILAAWVAATVAYFVFQFKFRRMVQQH